MSTEFKKLMKDPKKLQKIMESAFRAVDIDCNGFLEKAELEQVLIQIGKDIAVESPTKDEVADILEEIDQNGDEKISRDEFQNLIQQILEMITSSE